MQRSIREHAELDESSRPRARTPDARNKRALAQAAGPPLASSLQRVAQDPSSRAGADILALQGAVGNQAVQRLIAASRVAPPPHVPSDGAGRATPPTLSTVADTSSQEVAQVDRRPEAAAHSELQALEPASPAAARGQAIQRMADTSSRRPALRGMESGGGGSPLPPTLRRKMERSFAADFSSVRVHEGREAESVGALAFARGADIHFARGQYRPESSHGQAMLGHELTHVVQQSHGRVRPTGRVGGLTVNSDPGLEREADVLGARAARGEPAVVPGSPTGPRAQGGSSIAQGYFLVPDGDQEYARMSVSRKIMIRGTQELWAHDDVIEASNRSLAARGSYVTMERTEVCPSPFGKGMLYHVVPKWDDSKPAHKGHERARLKEKNKNSTDGYITHADCFMNAQTVMGVDDSPIGASDLTAPYFKSGHTKIDPYSRKEAGARFNAGLGGIAGGFSGNSPSRSYYKFLYTAFPEFFDALRKTAELPTAVDASQAVNFTREFSAYAQDESKEGLMGLIRAYAALNTTRYRTLRPYFSEMFAVNEHLSPEVGDGLAVFNDPVEREKFLKANPDDDQWNYHFAGVVMKDRDDYVTLENFSVGADTNDNRDWLFKMYGKGLESFHKELAGKDGIGASPLTLGFTSSTPPTSGKLSTTAVAGLAALFGT